MAHSRTDHGPNLRQQADERVRRAEERDVEKICLEQRRKLEERLRGSELKRMEIEKTNK